jgi:hypothetical protein
MEPKRIAKIIQDEIKETGVSVNKIYFDPILSVRLNRFFRYHRG